MSTAIFILVGIVALLAVLLVIAIRATFETAAELHSVEQALESANNDRALRCEVLDEIREDIGGERFSRLFNVAYDRHKRRGH